MDWPTIAGLLISGGIVRTLIDVAVQGWRDQAAARGRRRDHEDDLMRSRLVWMTDNARVRSVAYRAGATADQVGPLPDDPYDD